MRGEGDKDQGVRASSSAGWPVGVALMGLPRDASFKRFVHHSLVILHLLRIFRVRSIEPAQIAEVTDTRANLVGRQSEQRHVDTIWKVRMRNGTLFYLLIECQSERDPGMHWRMAHAATILGASLYRQVDPGPSYVAGRDPSIRGLVAYSGKTPWNVPLDAAEADRLRQRTGNGGNPSFRYQVLDLRNMALPGGQDNLVVTLQRLQVAKTPGALREAAQRLRKLMRSSSQGELAGAFAAWITQVALPDLGVNEGNDTLGEVLEPLEEEAMTWADKERCKGMRVMAARIAAARFSDSVAATIVQGLQSVSDPKRLLEFRSALRPAPAPRH